MAGWLVMSFFNSNSGLARIVDMICTCGGLTRDHKLVKDYLVVGRYEKCPQCGRIHWLLKPTETEAGRVWKL